MKTKKKWVILGLFAIGIGVLLASQNLFSNQRQSKNEVIKIGTMNTTESQIVGNIISELMTHRSTQKTMMVNNLGSSSVAHQAMLRGDIDISATRYTGTEIAATLNQPAIFNQQEAQKVVKKAFTERFNQTWFDTYGFSNTYVLLVTPKVAEKYHLKTISDLAKVSSKLTMAVDSSWFEKSGDGYDAFVKKYQTNFKRILPMQIGLVYPSVSKGNVDVAMGYSTDSRIMSSHLVMLKDDLHFFPAYDTSMVVSNELLKRQPQLKATLNKLIGQINLEEMQKLNYQVDHQGLAPEKVAHDYLMENNYFQGGK
ncbi:osmoprotectant ABC transporter substrate-binding protein [Weissella diestrammenae]|uniref:Osmoprotectant ABC transporter substrate-binding protein n=1 Tax=Weissella diestrammenae TaxID=1162633 RepID=A0A7G9T536_9LACO|nr:osmoprotectant ABC transporter substrate-binding protein [Weissella diestrammenae]MCM0583065.1 osmoprotectant ABC transporter substrate-binding protein [Weissella diestrammenae]QNN75211.1 osmoprotectant ABC transporter substrate-binding protein [Weissella diestrammenae]